jgi:hypothetical protein
MHGSVCRVNQGDLPGERLAFIASRVGTKSQPGRSQSVHNSMEAGQCPWSKGTQEGGCAKTIQDERKPVTVSKKTKQTGEIRPTQWDWVERSVWTERMLEALDKGVKGGAWWARPQSLA